MSVVRFKVHSRMLPGYSTVMFGTRSSRGHCDFHVKKGLTRDFLTGKVMIYLWASIPKYKREGLLGISYGIGNGMAIIIVPKKPCGYVPGIFSNEHVTASLVLRNAFLFFPLSRQKHNMMARILVPNIKAASYLSSLQSPPKKEKKKHHRYRKR